MSIEKPRRSGHTPARKKRVDILRRLEDEILRGHWAPGCRLPGEWELCARFGASRPMVREALQTLKARGLVVSRRGSGSYVPDDPGLTGMSDMISNYAALRRDAPAFFELFDLRLMVETFCIRHVARSGETTAVDRLAACLERMKQSAGDLRRFGQTDIDYHLTLVEVAGHRLFRGIMGGLLKDLGRRFAAETYTDHGLVKRNLREHAQIQRAIAAGDAENAERRLTAHLTQSRTHLERMVQELEGVNTHPKRPDHLSNPRK